MPETEVFHTSDTVVFIHVKGTPAPKGSYKPVNGRSRVSGKRITRLVPMSKAERPWRDSVELAVKNLPDPIPRFENMPLGVRVQFFILRPKSVSKKKRYYPTVKPDLDKLQRSTFDGLTDSGIIADDSLIVNVEASKHYVSDSDEVGAYITIFPLPIPQD